MSQAVPDFGLVLDEITRVLRPDGWLHLLSEDYLMLHMPDGPREPDRFWLENPVLFLQRTGCDGRIGRPRLAYAELDDDFLASLGSFDSLDALRTDIRTRLEANAIDRARHQFADRIIEFKKIGVNLFLTAYLHFQEEVAAFGQEIIPIVREKEAELARANGTELCLDADETAAA